MTDRRILDTVLRLLGWVLVAGSAVFLLVVGHSHWNAISAIALTPRAWLAIGGLAIVYGFGLLLTALVWHLMLMFTGTGAPDPGLSFRSHTSAQLAKYVPGNVFHFLGRHLMHRAAGMEDRRLALAALLENGVLVFAAACVAALCLALAASGPYAHMATIAGAGLLVAMGVTVIGVRLAGLRIGPLIGAVVAGWCFFALMAAVVGLIATILGAGFAWGICGSGIAAWIAGFVTPGSPGGLGVREAAMVLLGGDTASRDILLTSALLFRVVTFGGDIVCAGVGRVLLRKRLAEPVCAS